MKPLEFPILTDENIQPLVLAWLRDRGLDVRSVFDEHLNAQPDADILARAHAQGRVVLTHDSDFGRLAILRRDPLVG